MQYLKSLEKLGLNQKEQEVYFALLQLEKATANQVAVKSKIKRPTTYDILYRLEQNGFVFGATENNKRLFVANPPEKLSQILDERKRELALDLPYLTSIYNTKAKRPKVSYFEGVDGIKQLFEDTLTSCKKSDEILAYVTVETVKFLPDYTKDYVKRRVQKGIHLRGFYNGDVKINSYLKNDKAELRESKIVSAKTYPFKNEINIYADKMIIITYAPEPFGVLIESKEIADTQRAIFTLSWQSVK